MKQFNINRHLFDTKLNIKSLPTLLVFCLLMALTAKAQVLTSSIKSECTNGYIAEFDFNGAVDNNLQGSYQIFIKSVDKIQFENKIYSQNDLPPDVWNKVISSHWSGSLGDYTVEFGIYNGTQLLKSTNNHSTAKKFSIPAMFYTQDGQKVKEIEEIHKKGNLNIKAIKVVTCGGFDGTIIAEYLRNQNKTAENKEVTSGPQANNANNSPSTQTNPNTKAPAAIGTQTKNQPTSGQVAGNNAIRELNKRTEEQYRQWGHGNTTATQKFDNLANNVGSMMQRNAQWKKEEEERKAQMIKYNVGEQIKQLNQKLSDELLKAEQGDIKAMHKIADAYYKLSGSRPQDERHHYSKIAREYKRIAAETGDVNSMKQYAKILHSIGNYKTAEEWYAKAGNKGDIYSLLLLGDCYTNPNTEAYKAYKYAAQRLNVNANEEKAMIWYTKAIRAGSLDAFDRIGQLYYEKRDWQSALQFYQFGAEEG